MTLAVGLNPRQAIQNKPVASAMAESADPVVSTRQELLLSMIRGLGPTAKSGLTLRDTR
jgi:hypothetical protein